MKNDAKNRSTDLFADIGGLEPADFYSERRDSARDAHDFMQVLNDQPLATAPRVSAHTPSVDDDILNSFQIAMDDAATKRIFAEVNDFDVRRRSQSPSRLANAITDEILRVDLPDDETFVEDVVASYPSTATQDLSDQDEALFSVRIDEQANFAAPQTRHFVPPAPSIRLDFDEQQATNERLNSLSAALEDASANQDEIQKSIQIALEDVKRHQDQDEALTAVVDRAPTRATTEQIAPIPTLFVATEPQPTVANVAAPIPTIVIEKQPAPVVSRTKTVSVSPLRSTQTVPVTPTAQVASTVSVSTTQVADPAPYAANFKRPATDFYYQDNTQRPRTLLRDTPTSPILRTEAVVAESTTVVAPPPTTQTQRITRPINKPTMPVTVAAQDQTQQLPLAPTTHIEETQAQNLAMQLNEAVLDELRRYANEAVKEQMDVELAKLEGQRAQLQTIERQQAALDQLREQEVQNLTVNLEAIRQADELEASRASLDEERERFRLERQKMADEFYELSQHERESMAAERERLLNEARTLREQMLAEAQDEIDNERARLQREIEAQREMLLEVAEREKERLEDAVKLAKTQYIDDAPVVIAENITTRFTPPTQPITPEEPTKEIPSPVTSGDREAALLDELRGLMSEIRGLKAADQEKFEQLRSELSLEARNAVSASINASPVSEVADKIERISSEQKENFEQLADKIEAAAVPVTDYSEMLPVHENRSYTERVIDDLEDDDAKSEDAFVNQVVQYEQPQYVTEAVVESKPIPATEHVTQEVDPAVDTLRDAMRSPQDTDLEFEAKRLAYERDYVKEEIKREVLQEMSRLTGGAVKFNSSVTTEVGGHDESATTNFVSEAPQSAAVMTGSDAVPELAAKRANESVRNATRLYDFDLFDELGIEAFEADDVVQRAKTVKVEEKQPTTLPDPATKEVLPPPVFNTPTFTPSPLDLPPPEADKFKGRNAHLLLNHKYGNLSSAELIKSYARDLRRRMEQKKK